jgi:hypothetical protein
MLTIEEKEDLFLSEILNQRKQSANLITSTYKQIHSSKLIIKKFLFLKYLLSKRKKAQEKIIATIKGYLVHKKVSSYLSKVKTSFIITTEIEGYENLKMKVYFGKKEKIFDVIKDPFLNKLAIYIPRNKITKNEYQVNFLTEDNQIVIDPSYFTSEENGQFVNIINFARIKKEEIEKIKENAKELKFVCMYLKSEGIKFTEKGIEYEKDRNNNSIRSNSPQTRRRTSMSIKFNRKFNLGLNTNLPKPKSILKLSMTQINETPVRNRRASVATNLKKVSFGSVEFSY